MINVSIKLLVDADNGLIDKTRDELKDGEFLVFLESDNDDGVTALVRDTTGEITPFYMSIYDSIHDLLIKTIDDYYSTFDDMQE